MTGTSFHWDSKYSLNDEPILGDETRRPFSGKKFHSNALMIILTHTDMTNASSLGAVNIH